VRFVRLTFGLAACLLAALAISACGGGGSSSSSSGSTEAAAETASGTGGEGETSGEGTESGGSGISQETVALTAKYVGVHPEKADMSLPPVEIGFINQSGSVPAFPEHLEVGKATEKFINENLGGVEGHPLKLNICITQSEADGQKCAAKFLANKNINIVQMALSVEGNASFYKTVGDQLQTIVDNPGAEQDYSSPNVWELDGGGTGELYAVALPVKEKGIKNVTIVSSNNPAGKYTTEKILAPQMEKFGATVKTAYVSDTATSPEYVSALQAAGGQEAEMISLIAAATPACVSLYEGIKQLGIEETPVSTLFTCWGPPMPEITGGGPNGWPLASLSRYQGLESPESKAYRNAMETYGAEKYMMIGNTPKTFGDMLTIDRWANEIGFENLTPDAFKEKIMSFRGPMWAVPGKIECGHNKVTIGVCGFETPVTVYNGSEWEALPDVKAPAEG